MTTTNTSHHYKTSYIIGLLLCLASFLIYLWNSNDNNRSDFLSGGILINFSLVYVHLVILFLSKIRLQQPRQDIPMECWINQVVLFTISAFTLNQEMSVFAPFPVWLNIYTLSLIGVFLAIPYVPNLPSFFKALIYFFSGAALLLSIYMSLFLLPVYPITLISFWFFGLSLHAFVPLLWICVLLVFLFKRYEPFKLKRYVWLGISAPLIILSVYLYKWNTIQIKIKEVLAQKNLQLTNQLPDDILLAQKLPADPMTELILVSQFNSQDFSREIGFSEIGSKGKYHDPLAIVAIGLFGDIDIDEQTVVSLLNLRRDFRHQSRRRLWTGTSLSTISVSNNIKLFPSYRMAYHEKTLVIHNSGYRPRNFWFSTETQEALYTFHVPEGSIVTSLSLWINGKEEKSRLTTTSKADSAYTQIVGVQRRDPALVHWQEGNCVTVNVFPCTVSENRTFKIGFTTPLKMEDGKLWLENVWFEGPECEYTQEATQLMCDERPIDAIDLPGEFEKNLNGNYQYNGEYMPYWKLSINAVPLSTNKFSFGGNDYKLSELGLNTNKLNFNEVYLDVTKEWSREEFEKAVSELSTKKVYVWTPEKIKVTKENKDKVWEVLSELQFSLPFFETIKHPESAVVLTKSGHRSPLLCEMQKSAYAEKSTTYFLNAKQSLKVINFGTELSPLWRSLRELRLIDYGQKSLEKALSSINKGEFESLYEDESTVTLNDSRMSVVKTATKDSITTGNAPDHLLRVFAYNDVLRKMGKYYFKKDSLENNWIREAEEGYVVTPISSMIVLESQADYDKMGIGKNKNTVGNASVAGGGAVPEPHEWALIGLVVFFILRHLYQKRKEKLMPNAGN
ncbi:MAG: XrtN system VIT domain-containing protein [Bacteroidia bacterium]|nr:XrtN system VIT domain-containing protein [Bacteroidia bacterium]